MRLCDELLQIVTFSKPFIIQGAVENWLNDLNRVQQSTMAYVLEQAIEAAVNWEHEKPRHEWLRDYPAQLVLTACLVYWTEECQAALDELEGGQEDSVKKYLAVRDCVGLPVFVGVMFICVIACCSCVMSVCLR